MKYRKRPSVIEAEQWQPGKDVDGVIVVDGKWREAHVITLEGILHVSPGDWIITGTLGEHWPVRADRFAATYDPVDEAMA